MSATLDWGDIALRLASTLAAGILVGLDRGEHAQPAGLRTTVLVGIAAAAAMLLADLVFIYTPDTRNAVLRLDPMRLPLGVLSGIGFIGGGAILRRGELVLGVTTAATLWLVTVIGLCFGAGWFGLGIVSTAIAIATLWPLRAIERWLHLGHRGSLLIETMADGPDPDAVLALLRDRGFLLRARQLVIEPQAQRRSMQCSGRYRADYPGWSSRLLAELTDLRGVLKAEWHDLD